MSPKPACRTNTTAADLAHEADRAILYGAILLVQRPNARLKPAIAAAAQALAPQVRAFLHGHDNDEASTALAYARACGAETFLRSKQKTYRPDAD